MLLALSLMPALLGPMMAPRLLPVAAPFICPADTVGAETTITASRGRKGTSYNWSLRCESNVGIIAKAPSFRANAAAWALFNAIFVAAIAGSVAGYRALDKRLRPRTNP